MQKTDPSEILASFDVEQRQNAQFTDSRLEQTENVSRQIGVYAPMSFLLWADTVGTDLESLVQGEVEYFDRLEHDVEWKIFEHDPRVEALKEVLTAQGFEADEREALMALDISTANRFLRRGAPTHDIRRLYQPGQIMDVMAVEEEVWDAKFYELDARLRRDMTQFPDQLSVYVAYVHDKAVSAAWIYLPPKTQFASLWGGSTLEEYRGRGIYSQLLAVRLQEARHRGYRYLYVDASSMSQPILAKHGFQLLTYTQPYIRRHRG